MEELLSLVLPPKQSLDQDLDPCKSPAFLGDIVYPEANLTIVKVIICNNGRLMAMVKGQISD